MKKTKYVLGAGAMFALGFATCYYFTGDLMGLWNKTKYVANKTQTARAEYDKKADYIKPGQINKIDDVIIEGLHDKTREDAGQEKAECIKSLDDKILKYELDENSDKVISDFLKAEMEYGLFKAKVSHYLTGRESRFQEGSAERYDLATLQGKIAAYELDAKKRMDSTQLYVVDVKDESPACMVKNMSITTDLIGQQVHEDLKYIDSVMDYASKQKDSESKLIYEEAGLAKQKRKYYLSMVNEIQGNMEKNLGKAQSAYEQSNKK